jgi:hypothetical protein
MNAHILYMPQSGGDQRHYVNELRKAEQARDRLVREAEAALEWGDEGHHRLAFRALAEAHRLDCELWSTRLFLGVPDNPSPSIADALHGGYELLEVQCRYCNHTQMVDLALVSWPRERPVHSIHSALYCGECEERHGKRSRPDLVGLRTRPSDDPGGAAWSERMKTNEEMPPAVAREFVEDMQAYFAEDNKSRRDAIAVRQLRTLLDYQAPHEKKLRLDDVRELFERMKYHA